ncbi:hypothetical protein GCM10007082_17290 [Oceanisphaera arctica]|nr:hypothetical protein GCM10007082_17290 [Oceanisphaera arctica]
MNTEYPADGANRPRRNLKEDKGICFIDHHMTGMSCAERHKEVLDRVEEAGPLSGVGMAITKSECSWGSINCPENDTRYGCRPDPNRR